MWEKYGDHDLYMYESEHDNFETVLPTELPFSEHVIDHNRKNFIDFRKNRRRITWLVHV